MIVKELKEALQDVPEETPVELLMGAMHQVSKFGAFLQLKDGEWYKKDTFVIEHAPLKYRT
jgi:hypothetical protein